MQIEDDRTDAEHATHTVLVGGTDRCLSGWGKAEGGKSYVFWACLPEHEKTVLEWVERRSDLDRVRVVGNDYAPKGKGHCRVYRVRPGHPALASWERMHGVEAKEDGTLPAFAWPGGYPILYVLADGETLCAKCANGENGSEASTDSGTDAQWRIIGQDIHWEGEPETCAHCNGQIESAYGVPE